MNGIAAYNGKAADYAAYRLPYAVQAVQAIWQITNVRSTWRQADIASGTGSVSRLFIGHVAHVFGVEPNEEMRTLAERLLDTFDTFESIDGTAEHTTLPAASVDLITVGQAWHWFDPRAAVAEFARILRPDGWIALIWNQLEDENEPDLTHLFPHGQATCAAFPMAVEESWELFLGGARAASTAPSTSDPAYRQFEREQRQVFLSRAVGGMLTVEYTTEVAVGKLPRIAAARAPGNPRG